MRWTLAGLSFLAFSCAALAGCFGSIRVRPPKIDGETIPRPPVVSPAELVFDWGLAAVVATGLAMLVLCVVGIVITNAFRTQGLPIRSRGLWVGALLGVALVATALAVEIAMPYLVAAVLVLLAVGVAYGAWWGYSVLREAHKAPPPEPAK